MEERLSGHDINKSKKWCWQDKDVLKILRKNFRGEDLVKLRVLYQTLTEMESDSNNKQFYYYTNSIKTYSGLYEKWIPKGLKILEELKIITSTIERTERGRIKGKIITFHENEVDSTYRLLQPGGNNRVVATVLQTPNNNKKVKKEESNTEESNNIKNNKEEPLRVSNVTVDLDNVSNDNNSSVKSKYKLSVNDYNLFIPLLRYWNSLDNLTTHKLPVNSDDAVLATIKHAVNYMKYISGGEFFKKYSADRASVPREIMSSRISFEQIKEQMSKLNQAWEADNEPRSKKYLPRSISDFLYKEYGGNNRSYFYDNFNTPIVKLNGEILSEEESDIPEAIIEKYIKVMTGHVNKAILVERLVDMKDWYDDVYKRMGLILKVGTKFDSYFGTFSAFCNQHIEYLKGYNYDITPGYLKLTGKAWQFFMDWTMKEYELDLKPSPDKRKNMLKARKRTMIQHFGVSMHDFIDGGMYTQEEWDEIGTGKYRK